MNSPEKIQAKLDKYTREREKLLARLGEVGFIWHGSVHRSLLTCGRPACRCHEDRSARHGPYAYWTTKVAGKTVSRLLPPDEADLYEEWIENRRCIEGVVRKLKALSAKAAPLVLKLNARTGAQRRAPVASARNTGPSRRRPPAPRRRPNTRLPTRGPGTGG